MSKKSEEITKLPKLFNRDYSKKKFHAKLLKHVATPADQRLLLSLFTQNEDESYSPITPPGGDAKSIHTLAKSIKRNRKRIRKGRLIFLLAVLAILIGGVLLFKNSLAEQALERGFGGVLQTEVEVSGTKLHIFQNRITYDRMEIVDDEKQSHNMVVMGKSALQIDINQFFRSNIIIPELSAEDIAWDVPRENYRELVSEETEEKATEEKDPIDIFKDPTAELLRVYEEAKDALTTPPLVTEIKDEYITKKADLESRVENLQSRFETLQGRVEEVSQWSKEYFMKHPEKLPTAQSTIEGIIDEVEVLFTDAQALQEEIRATADKIPADKERIDQAVETDMAYLKENFLLTDLSTEEIVALLGELFLEESINEYLEMGTKVVKIVQKLTPNKEKKSKPSREGRIVEFGTEYPSFALGRFFVNYTDTNQAIEVLNLSSNPALWGATPAGSYEESSGNKIFKVAADTTMEGDITASVIRTKEPLEVPLTELGIESFTGEMDMDFAFDTGTNRMEATFDIYNQTITPRAESSKILTTFTDILQQEDSISWSYLQEAGKVSLTSSLDEPLSRALNTLLEELKSEGTATLEKMLQGDLAEPLSALTEITNTIGNWKEKGNDILSKIDEAKVLLEEKKAEIKKYLANGLLDNLPGGGGLDSLPSLPGGNKDDNKGGGLFSGFGG